MGDSYRKLDIAKLASRKHGTISTSDALRSVSPMGWNPEVYTGEKKVLISKQVFHLLAQRWLK